MPRESLSVADLIPGDILIPKGWEVVGYPWGIRALPGTIIPFNKNGGNVILECYFGDSETQVEIIRD